MKGQGYEIAMDFAEPLLMGSMGRGAENKTCLSLGMRWFLLLLGRTASENAVITNP